MITHLRKNTMATTRKFGPQYWVEGRKWGDLSTPTRLHPQEPIDFTSDDWFEGVARRTDAPPPPEPTWQELFHDLNDLLTGSTAENRNEVSPEQMGSLIISLNPPRPLPPPIVYKEPALSEYELARQGDLEKDVETLATLRQTYHDNRKKLKELMLKQDAVAEALSKKEDEWAKDAERQKKMFRPRHLPPLDLKKPTFREEKELDSLTEQLTELRIQMSDHNIKAGKLKQRIAEGELFMKEAHENLEILREYRKFDQTLVGGYISY